MLQKWHDFRDLTYKKRLEIGFDQLRDKWPTAKAKFDHNKLTICGHPVMERWEDNYMKELARVATQNGGTVMEVGFGMGISAKYIQEANIEKHIIVEANEDVLRIAKKFATQARRPVKAIYGFWEKVTAAIPSESISGILFDTYPLTPEEVHKNHYAFFKEAFRLLKLGGVFTYYSDEMSHFSKEHLEQLKKAGFRRITCKTCPVEPPQNCQYWKSKRIIVPIIFK